MHCIAVSWKVNATHERNGVNFTRKKKSSEREQCFNGVQQVNCIE